MPSQTAFKVFLSHSENDYELVLRVWDILFRLNTGPYMHELYPDYRSDIPTGIRDVLRNCSICITFLTKDGINSQWVQQELGIAYAFNRIIVPVLETGVEYKGFVQMIRQISYNPNNPDLMIYQVIYAVRTHVIGYEAIRGGLTLTCPSGHEHDYDLPSNIETNKVIDAHNTLSCKCATCGVEIEVNPTTLEIIK
jgi:hypothetical protein